MPRFLRVGDEIYLKTRVDNLSDQAIEAQVSLNLINPNNNQSLDKNFKLKNKSQSVNIPAHGTQVVTWKIEIRAIWMLCYSACLPKAKTPRRRRKYVADFEQPSFGDRDYARLCKQRTKQAFCDAKHRRKFKNEK